MDRRQFIAAGLATAGAAVAGSCSPAPSYPPQSGMPFEGVGPFPSGISSADPLPDRVLLWARAHPERDAGSGVDLRLEVATSRTFAESTVVHRSSSVARAGRDHCVQVDVAGLHPGTTYWYRFSYDGHTSAIGRTRTAPAPEDHVGAMRLAAFSCQRWTHGWYTAHADLAALADAADSDVDLVLSLGDYVYDTEYADGVYVPGRDDPIQTAVTHGDFRSKYRLYRSDPNLQEVHARFPVVHLFDNHDGPDAPGDPKAAGALAAFDEHVPVRRDAPDRLYRRLSWGSLAEVFLTDQRSYRDPVPRKGGPLGTSSHERPEILDPDRTMLGRAQADWLLHGLAESTATWKVIGSPLMFWPWRTLGKFPWEPRGTGTYLNLVQWDGYVAERHRLLDHLEANGVEDTLLLSGDSHVFSAAQVAPDVDDPRSTPRVVELGTGSITSGNADESGFPTDDVTWPLLRAVNPNHLRYFESERHGYVVVELSDTGASAEVRSPRTVLAPNSTTEVLARFQVERGTQRIRRIA